MRQIPWLLSVDLYRMALLSLPISHMQFSPDGRDVAHWGEHRKLSVSSCSFRIRSESLGWLVDMPPAACETKPAKPFFS